MKIENIALLLTPIILIVILSTFEIAGYTHSSNKNEITNNIKKPPIDSESDSIDTTESEENEQEQISENETDSSEEFPEVDKMLQAYEEIQQEEEAAFQNKIEKKWGEYKSSSAKEWLSYSETDNVRRTVNYETGEVSVEILLSGESMISESVKKLLEKETHKLLNSTEEDAYLKDEVSQKIESRLPKNNNIIARGNPEKTPLFNIDRMPELSFNYSGFQKVSSNAKTMVNARIKKSKTKEKVIAETTLKLDESILRKTSQYAKILKQMANKQHISPALVYAIIESESNFNPMAKSHIPAYGLMQIVPESAGRDATIHIWGKPKVLAPSYLYSSINNIHIGTAYLHVLYYKYLKKVKDEQSRAYLTIAAYNTGASNVARAFIHQKNFNRAAKKINKMSSDQVYRTLVRRLPYRETRKYVKKVTKAMNHYWTMQQQDVI